VLSAPAVCRLPSAISRRPRFPVTGYPLHVVQRGNDRQPCFFAEADYVFYLDSLGNAAQHYAVQSQVILAQGGYARWCGETVDDDELARLRDATNHELAFGDDRFKAQIEAATSRRTSAMPRGRGAAGRRGQLNAG